MMTTLRMKASGLLLDLMVFLAGEADAPFWRALSRIHHPVINAPYDDQQHRRTLTIQSESLLHSPIGLFKVIRREPIIPIRSFITQFAVIH